MDRNFVFVWSFVARLVVALRKESVDRNIVVIFLAGDNKLSLSARRAWIEIYLFGGAQKMDAVALRKESVDRNHQPTGISVIGDRRSPQGERG